MTTKVPGSSILTNASTPSTQSTPSTVTSSSPVYNNNNSKISGVATSIITAPLMSQSQSANSMQKQSANNVTVTTTAAGTAASPGKSVTSGVPASGPTVSASSAAGGKPSENIKAGAVSAAPPADLKKAGGVSTSASANITSAAGPAAGSSTRPKSPVPPTSVPLSKPTDFNKSIMNGGATAVLKQPPPPVTILPPTPAATPPSIHRQPPSLPQAPANPPPTTDTTNNQKSQSGPAPPPSSTNNNTPMKHSSISSTTPSSTIQKIENQEVKPTQPLPVQHQGNPTSSPAYKQGVQPKDQKATPSENQKIINSATSSVTDPAALANTSIESSAKATAISSTPTTVASSGSSINKPVVQSVSQPTPVATSTVVSSTQVNKKSTPSINPSVKKMEGMDEMKEGNVPMTASVVTDKGQMKENPSPRSGMIGGGGDAPSFPTENYSNMKSSVDADNSKENMKNELLSGSNTSKADPTHGMTDKNEGSSKVDQILAKANDMNKSIYIPSSNEEPIIGTSEKPIASAYQNKKHEGIGEDVQRIMDAIENAGLCGPKTPENDHGSRPTTQGGISNGTRNRPMSRPATATSRPTTAASPLKRTNATSPTKSRPSTASSASRKDHATANGVSGIPTLSSAKSPKEKVAPASGTSNGSPASLLPKTGTSASGLRTSTSRVASAKVNTAPAATNKTPNENKNTRANANGADSCSASPVETETGLSSATGSRSTPRLRPSSSLYRPTASSALKGVSSAAHNSTSNHNLPSSPSPRSRSSTGARTSRSAITMGDSAGGSGEGKPPTLKDNFTAFARFGNKEEDGKHITLSNCDKWMKQAKVIDGKKITTTDTSICFKKLFKTAKKITFEDFKKYVEELAKSKKMEPQELLDKLTSSGAPGLSSATRTAHSNVVDRLTDTSKYTGSHKERFDATGKGRGIEGRKDVPDGSGYVAAFKEKLDLKEKDEGPSTSPTPAK